MFKKDRKNTLSGTKLCCAPSLLESVVRQLLPESQHRPKTEYTFGTLLSRTKTYGFLAWLNRSIEVFLLIFSNSQTILHDQQLLLDINEWRK